MPIHAIGYGRSHDPSSLWLLSNHTSGSYTFVKDFCKSSLQRPKSRDPRSPFSRVADDLRDALTGCVGGIMSVAVTNLRLHVRVPESRWFRIRKVSGTPGAVIAHTGVDVDVELGEMRFGERKDLIVEVEMAFDGYEPRSGRGVRADPGHGREFSSATETFFLTQAGVDLSALDASGTSNLYADEYDAMPDELPLFQVRLSFSDGEVLREQPLIGVHGAGQRRISRPGCRQEHFAPYANADPAHHHRRGALILAAASLASSRPRTRPAPRRTPRQRHALASTAPHDSAERGASPPTARRDEAHHRVDLGVHARGDARHAQVALHQQLGRSAPRFALLDGAARAERLLGDVARRRRDSRGVPEPGGVRDAGAVPGGAAGGRPSGSTQLGAKERDRAVVLACGSRAVDGDQEPAVDLAVSLSGASGFSQASISYVGLHNSSIGGVISFLRYKWQQGM